MDCTAGTKTYGHLLTCAVGNHHTKSDGLVTEHSVEIHNDGSREMTLRSISLFPAFKT